MPASTKISARLKRVQGRSSPVNDIVCTPARTDQRRAVAARGREEVVERAELALLVHHPCTPPDPAPLLEIFCVFP